MNREPQNHYINGRRLRMFAGPNGSGKSTLKDDVAKHCKIGYYINADEIEKQLNQTNYILLSDFGVEKCNKIQFSKFLKATL